MRTSRPTFFVAALAAALSATAAFSQPFATPSGLPAAAGVNSTEMAPGRPYFGGQKFDQPTGKAIYESICQGCHMPGGKGAVGAGMYPAFANSKNLGSSAYVLTILLNGHKGMPPFGQALDDAQVAQITNYIRTNFGNNYTDAVAPADVKALRPAPSATAGSSVE